MLSVSSNQEGIPWKIQKTFFGRPVRIASYAPAAEKLMGLDPWAVERWLFHQGAYNETYLIAREEFFQYAGRPFCFIQDSAGDWLPIAIDCLIFCSPTEFPRKR